jgi:hypothetical protein
MLRFSTLVFVFVFWTKGLFAGSFSDSMTINGTTFIFRTDTGITSACEGEVSIVTLIRVKDGKRTTLLSHVLESGMCDCNSVQLELGSWEVKDNLITFYSYWAKVGDAPGAPCGMRKQVYLVTDNGKVSLSYSHIYLKEYGMVVKDGEEYFYDEEEPENRKIFSEYYHGQFVNGGEGKKLETEVLEKMRSLVTGHTGKWVDTGLGICR